MQVANGGKNMLESTTAMPKEAKPTPEKLPQAKVVAGQC